MASPAHQRKVLIAVDHSANSEYAFKWFIESAYKPGDFLIVCHIPEICDLPSFTFKSGLHVPADEWQVAIQKEIERTQKLHDYYQSELEMKKIPYDLVGEHSNSPGPAIIEAAHSRHVDCIVIGTRSLDALKRAFKGSVSDFVVHHADCPVMVIPNKGKK